MSAPLVVRLHRGPVVEAEHRLALAVVERDRVVTAAGDVDRVVLYRSGAKPIQALAVIESGAAEAFRLSAEELAVAAGSHGGEERHVRAARSILAKAGLDESLLACGAHWPSHDGSRSAMIRAGESPAPIHNNCSGKHAGMLAAAKALGAPLESYLDPAHPVQRRNLANVSFYTGVPEDEIAIGVDGCSAPVFGAPLSALARSFARLVDPPAELPAEKRAAAARILDAMAAHPGMVGGLGRSDTEILAATNGRIVAKIGAEGLQMLGVRGAGVGLALKVEDGNPRAYKWALRPLLRALGFLDEEEARQFGSWADFEQRNWRGLSVGRVEVDLGSLA